MKRSVRFVVLVIGVIAASLTVGCGTGKDEQLTVFAAASLTDAFTRLGDEFASRNEGITVRFNFAASSALAVQLVEGAPADVFASADTVQMSVVEEAGVAHSPATFAGNLLVVVARRDGPVSTFEDLARPGLRLVLAAPDVPAGRYAREVLQKAASGEPGTGFSDGVLANLRSNEANVRGVLTKVELGEADAGIVYATDASNSKGDIITVAIPDTLNVTAEYPIAILSGSKRSALAAEFVAFVLSEEGQAILREYGFAQPARSEGTD